MRTLLPALACMIPLAAGALDLYVAPGGDDAAPGTLEKPFRTIDRARNRVRERVAAGLKEDIRVHLRGGTYTLTETLVFDERDSGTTEHAVVYQAFEDEKAVISGGRALGGKWERHDGNIWRLSLPEVKRGKTWFRQVFVHKDGQVTRATRARWPNQGEMARTTRADNTALVYHIDKMLPVGGIQPSDHAEVQLFKSWVSSRARIRKAAGQALWTDTMPGNPHRKTRPQPDQCLFLEHAYGFIDLPGEWYLDRDDGTLFLMMNAGEDPNAREFYTGRLETLLRIAGTVRKPVVNLHVRKLRFQFSFWDLPEIGFGDMWTGNYGTVGKGENWVRHVPLAIECEYLRDCGFEMCDVAHMGGSGIGFGRGARGNRVVGCRVYDIGAIGINVGWRTRASPTGDGWVHYDRRLMTDLARAWGGEAHVPGDNRVTDNHVHRCGQVYEGCAGIFLAFQRNFQISHNIVHTLPYGCIVQQHFAGRREDCVTSYNHIFDGMLLLGDGGAIYTSVADRGAHIHHNFIHDITRRPGAVAKGNVGIYLDEYANHCLVEHNALANIADAEMKIHRSKGHTIRDNIGLKGFIGGDRYLNAFGNTARELTEEERAHWNQATGPREPYRSRPQFHFTAPENRAYGLQAQGGAVNIETLRVTSLRSAWRPRTAAANEKQARLRDGGYHAQRRGTPARNAARSGRYSHSIRIADNLLLHQRDNGGWPKNYDRQRKLSDRDKKKLLGEKKKTDTTFDNAATHSEVRHLARAYSATRDQRYKEAFLRGVEFMLRAQYENGGWPQSFPHPQGYQKHITFNDGAMIGVMTVLRDIAKGAAEYAFVDRRLRARCADAVERGIDCILKCQIDVHGRKTAWCAQHDEKNFAPRKARSYELASISGSESVGIVRFLMAIDKPTPEVVAAVQGAVAWFDDAKLRGIKLVTRQDESKPKGKDKVVVKDPAARPMWARFYKIGTNEPIFCSRDGIPRDSLEKISYERRNGYMWLGYFATGLLARDYPAWQKKWAPHDNVLSKNRR